MKGIIVTRDDMHEILLSWWHALYITLYYVIYTRRAGTVSKERSFKPHVNRTDNSTVKEQRGPPSFVGSW